MQKIDRKRKKSGSRMMLTGIALLVLSAIAVAVFAVLPSVLPSASETGDMKETEKDGFAHRDGDEPLLPQHAESEIVSFSVSLDTGERWSAVREGDDFLIRSGEETFYGSGVYMRILLLSVNMLESQPAVAPDFGAYAEHRTDFGLDAPHETVTVTYADGVVLTASIGSTDAAGETAGRYMLLEGRPELFVVEDSVWKDLYIEAAILRPTDQPTVHAARIDRITLTDETGVREWALDAAITDPDAADRWSLVRPYRYAADGDAMSTLRKNLENLRMGTWVAEATAEARTAYGFDDPRAVIAVHMAPGTVMTAGAGSAVVPADFDEDDFSLLLGNPRNDMVDYVLWADTIYTMPHWMVSGVLDTVPLNTLTRYPVLTGLSNLKHLTVETSDETQVWIVTRAQRVAQNNALMTEPDGTPVTDVSLTCNGAPADWDAFAVRYNRLLSATVSGVLPEGWESPAPPHTLYTFETETDTVHTIALTDYDLFNDAVWVDGAAVFYIKKGALALTE